MRCPASGDTAGTRPLVRRAAARDLGSLVALRREMFRAMGVTEADSRPWQEAAGRWFAERLTHPDYGIFVVETDEGVVAGAVGAVRDAAPSPACPEGRDVLVSTVCTMPSQRGRGHARRAFGAVMEWARSTGVRRVELMATSAGRSLYEREGFAEVAWPAMRKAL